MKTLEKKEFVKFLKIISHNLNQAEIKHEIPFCHIDKQTWNYINIIIPDFITTYDITKILNTNNIKEKSGIIYTVIDDFDVRFIKSSEDLWSYSFYFYAWDTLHILMNVLTSRYSMSYTRTGLYYNYGQKKIFLTKNLKDVFDFFDLPFHMITNGFATDYVMFSYIETAKYFNSEDFTLDKLKKLDYYFDNNKDYYDDFIKHIPEIVHELDPLEDQIGLIDAFFHDSNFFQKLTRIQLKEEFPKLKDNDPIFVEKKSIDTLLNDKTKELNNLKKKKKINLGKYFKKKDDPGNADYRLED